MLLDELRSYKRSLSTLPLASLAFQRNRLKEYLHIYLLDFLYKHNIYRELIFYGGSCLRHCFELPRLSEDLDFESLSKDFDYDLFATDLNQYIQIDLGYSELIVKRQKFRIYLKFPVLKELGLVNSEQSDYLHLKIEINIANHPVDTYKTEIQPFFSMQRTFFIKRYDLSTLMSTKINAVLNRTWMRHHKEQGEKSDAKGRDYYDLLWYMQRKIKPRIDFCSFNSEGELWKEIKDRVESVSEKSIENDLIDFLDSSREAKEFAKYLKQAFSTLLGQYL